MFFFIFIKKKRTFMREIILIFLVFTFGGCMMASEIEKVYHFSDPVVTVQGVYHTFTFPGTRLSGLPGEPSLPWQEIKLMLPPGESAVSVNIAMESETRIPGTLMLYPHQPPRPLSDTIPGVFQKNEAVYRSAGNYPENPGGKLITQYLNGFGFAISTFTPVKYNPARGSITYFRKVTVRITTRPDAPALEAIKNLQGSERTRQRAQEFAQNPGMAGAYPVTDAPSLQYDYLIIAPALFQNEFQPLISMYAAKGITCQVITTETINSGGTGADLQEKIRNRIITEYQDNLISYVLLAGNPPLVPCRGFYCYVISTPNIEEFNIPADLYYSGLDGDYNADGDNIFGEVNDTVDLLPDVAVARFTVDDTAGLRRMIRKSIAYQTNPVIEEITKPLMAAEYLYNAPLTFGGPYMDLLINDHNDNGYFTHGIPSAANTIDKLYDTLISLPLIVWSWDKTMLKERINQGHSFIHHLGHANTSYMMRMVTSDITNANFPAINGIDHNYQLLYTQGCLCGAFDQAGCIAVKAVTIDNFLVAGVFNSRYGWFNQGTTDGPSQHLQREFVSAMYTDTLPEKHLGEVHRISKVETAPWVTMPGEFEPGAQRWCHYCCNAFGDPAMEIWTEEPVSYTTSTWTGAVNSDWNNPGNWSPQTVPTSLYNLVIPETQNGPSIGAGTTAVCHDLLIHSNSSLTIAAGKRLIVRGTTTLMGP
jgi:hypothetical protein